MPEWPRYDKEPGFIAQWRRSISAISARLLAHFRQFRERQVKLARRTRSGKLGGLRCVRHMKCADAAGRAFQRVRQCRNRGGVACAHARDQNLDLASEQLQQLALEALVAIGHALEMSLIDHRCGCGVRLGGPDCNTRHAASPANFKLFVAGQFDLGGTKSG
jgi:hypothetical protein